MLKKEQKISMTGGMKKLVKKILTDKLMRNATAMSMFVANAASVGQPWGY